MAGFVKLLITGDATTEVEAEATLVLAGDVTIVGSGKSLTTNDFRLGSISNIQIATGDVTQTGSYHSIEAETAADDQLDGISAGSDGQLLFIRPQDDAETITVDHNKNSAATNNILLDADTSYLMNDIDDYMFLLYDVSLDTNGAWIEISRGSGAAAAVLTSNAPADVGTTAAVGAGTEAARDNHVHDTATGFIDNVNKFAVNVVDNSAMADNAIGNAELADNAVDTAELNTNAVGNDAIDNTATDIAFLQLIITPQSNGQGTTTGTIYYDTEDARLYVFQA